MLRERNIRNGLVSEQLLPGKRANDSVRFKSVILLILLTAL